MGTLVVKHHAAKALVASHLPFEFPWPTPLTQITLCDQKTTEPNVLDISLIRKASAAVTTTMRMQEQKNASLA